LTLRETYALNRLSSFKNLRRKGGKFDHRPGRPKVLLRHWSYRIMMKVVRPYNARLNFITTRSAYVLGAIKLGRLRRVFVASFATRRREMSRTWRMIHIRRLRVPPFTAN